MRRSNQKALSQNTTSDGSNLQQDGGHSSAPRRRQIRDTLYQADVESGGEGVESSCDGDEERQDDDPCVGDDESTSCSGSEASLEERYSGPYQERQVGGHRLDVSGHGCEGQSDETSDWEKKLRPLSVLARARNVETEHRQPADPEPDAWGLTSNSLEGLEAARNSAALMPDVSDAESLEVPIKLVVRQSTQPSTLPHGIHHPSEPGSSRYGQRGAGRQGEIGDCDSGSGETSFEE